MIRSQRADGNRHAAGIPYLNQEMSDIISAVEAETGDSALAQSLFFSPTALTHVKRIIEMGGAIVTDTTIVLNEIDQSLLGTKGAQALCFIDDPRVAHKSSRDWETIWALVGLDKTSAPRGESRACKSAK